MAEYIENVVAQTSKLDWAFPFERKGQFPLDRSAVFSSLEDATKYAIGDGTDERKLGGTSYVGQVISVYEAAVEANADEGIEGSPASVNAYIITPARGLMKLAATTASGDVTADIAELQGKVNSVTSSVTTLEATVSAMYTNAQIDELIAGAKDDRVDGLVEDVKALEEAVAKLPTEDTNTTYTFVNGTEGKFTVTPKDGEAIEVDTGSKAIVDALDKKVTDAGYQNASQVSTAITTALTDYYNKASIDETVEDLEGKISAIPKFAIEVVSALPTENISYTTVYLVPDNDAKTADVYDEYIYVKVSETESKWELLGKQTLDLTGYATETFVTTEIAKLSNEGGAIKEVADAHNELALDVNELTETIGDENSGLVKDVADLKAIDHNKIVNDAITTHNTEKSHLTSDDVDGQIDAKISAHNSDKDHFTEEEIASQVEGILTTKDYEGKIGTAKQEAIDASLIKSVDEDQFTVTEGKLTLDAISQDKVTGLADTFANIYTKGETDNSIASAISDTIGNKPTVTQDENGKNVYSDASGIYVDIYTKDEVTDLISSFTGGESAADVLAELNKYKSSNDSRVKDIEDEIADIFNTLDTKLEGVKVNGVALAITNGVVDIPAATTEKFGVVKLGDEFKTNSDGALEIEKVNVNKLEQSEEDVLVLNGGLASSLITKE